MFGTKRRHYILDGVQYMECSKCGEMKKLDRFSQNKRCIFGKSPECKDCRKIYRDKNSERMKPYFREYYSENRDEQLKKHAEYREKNRDCIREYEKKYYWEHAEELREKQKKIRKESNRESVRQKAKRVISIIGVRPKECPICGGSEFSIEAHHPDYNKWNEIVFCCKSCHQLIHSGQIECPQPINLIELRRCLKKT